LDTSLGIATTIAVFIHEIPQEIGDYGVLIHGGYSRKRALFLNFLVALTAFLGMIVALSLSSYVSSVEAFFLPFGAGNFLYIATADLIPEIHKDSRPWQSFVQLAFMLLGIGFMLLVRLMNG